MRKFGPFGAGTSSLSLKESCSSPGPFCEDRTDDVTLMPPPMSLPSGGKHRINRLMRRGSEISELSRSDSVISDDSDFLRSSDIHGSGKLDSESDNVSYYGSETLDVATTDSHTVTSLSSNTGSKTSSPLVYTKTLNISDDGSAV